MELRTVNAVVTGGASGLGRATAERLVAAGGRVARLDRPAAAGADVAKTLGPSALFTPADVTSAGEVDTALRTAAERFGGLNVLVNCAGIGTAMKTLGKAGPAKLEDFTRVIQVNLIGTFNWMTRVKSSSFAGPALPRVFIAVPMQTLGKAGPAKLEDFTR